MSAIFAQRTVLSVALTVIIQAVAFSDDGTYRVPLYYDTTTGHVTIDTTDIPDGVFAGYSIGLQGSGGLTRAEALLPNNFTPFGNTIWVSASSTAVGETNFSGIPPGVYSLGRIITPNLDLAEITTLERFLNDPWQSSVVGKPGESNWYSYELIKGPSPFVPINDPDSVIPHHARWATDVVLSYDVRDGSVTLDTTGAGGGAVAMYMLETESAFNVDAFRETGGGLSNLSAQLISEVSFSGIAEGRYDLGTILPAGLTPTQLTDTLAGSRFIGQPGHSAPFDVDVNGSAFSLAHVPEPNTTILVGLAIMIALVGKGRTRGKC